MVEFLRRGTRQLGYEVTGTGPTIVLAHGLADCRDTFRHLTPLLVAAGYRVATIDLRGHGDSTPKWDSYTQSDTADDIAALIDHLGAPATVAGSSFSAGAAAILAADHPELVDAVIHLGPATRPVRPTRSMLRPGYLRGMILVGATIALRSPKLLGRFMRDIAYATHRPDDFDQYLEKLVTTMAQPGRMAAAAAMARALQSRTAVNALPRAFQPALIIMGTQDSDFPDPAAEATAIAALLPAPQIVMIPGAGHYPHGQFPNEVAAAILSFLDKEPSDSTPQN